jgi:diguanylate cyclase (GGDEF)-like protein
MLGPRHLRRLRTTLRQLAADPVTDPDERRLAGIVSSLLWIFGGGLLVTMPFISRFATGHHGLVLGLGLGCVVWGACALCRVDWTQLSGTVANLSALAGLAVVGVAVWATGGATSPVGLFLVWLALVGCYFCVANVAIAFMLACMLVQALPFVYDNAAAARGHFVILLGAYFAGEVGLGGTLIAGRALQIGRRRQAESDAYTDSLTGLSNHRVLELALADESRAVIQSGAMLSVVVLDLDHFKQINDSGGHAEGDRALVFVARSLNQAARREDVVTRSGGDEFTWLMPGLDAAAARQHLEQARALIQVTRSPALTISAGVCDSSQCGDPARLVQLADEALYWSKVHGRARTQIYDPSLMGSRSADERADKLEHSKALAGLRTLAVALDAQHDVTRGHSERVAALAGRLGQAVRWDAGRVARLRDAALLHDIGTLGVEAELRFSTERPSHAEEAQLRMIPTLSARAVAGLLDPEQLSWISASRERVDGNGYPSGLRGAALPEGAQILSVADAFDDMTSGAGGRPRISHERALAQCRAEIGRRFGADVVSALERLLGHAPVVAAQDMVVWRSEPLAAPAGDPA